MALVKRSLSIQGHRTSILLEPVFWKQLEYIAEDKNLSLPALIAHIDRQRVHKIFGEDDSDDPHGLSGRELQSTSNAPLQPSSQPASLASTLRVYVVENLLHTKSR